MRFYFDYFYYRIMKLFLKYPTDRGVRAIFLISLMQSMIALSLIEGCLPFFLKKSEMAELLSQIIWLIVFIVFGLFFFNFLNYQGRYSEFDQHWQNESKAKKTIKGLLVIFSLLIPFVVYAYLTSWVYHVAKGI
jgi:magnesium-transporting ATPase (P-type)